MRLTFEDARVALYDDVYDPETYEAIWHYLRRENYQDVGAGEWKRAWRLNDGAPLRSRTFLLSERPYASPMDFVLRALLEAARAHPHVVGQEGEVWDEIGMQVFLYRRGTRISWHQDTRYGGGQVAGSAALYLHPEWRATWGGELLVPEMADEDVPADDAKTGLIDGRDDGPLMKHARGLYVAPKPNRLVLISAKVPHCTARIDPDAGDHVRCSVSAFFGRRGLFTDVAKRLG
jgi:hypothetical protein